MDTLQTNQLRHLLPALPYDPAQLEPHVDARTMTLHHDKHHASYVKNLNAALEKYPKLHERSAIWLLQNLGQVPEEARTAVRNNAGGHVNHSMFWRAMTPGGSDEPTGALAEAIQRGFGDLATFKARFDEAGAKLFGSGWVWLISRQQDGGKLHVVITSGHGTPLTQGDFPLLVNDVWEHAYYLKHENRRADYLQNWWSVVNWREAEGRLARSALSHERRWDGDGGLVLTVTK